MFFQKPSNPDSPTVEPLRIQKRESRSPEPNQQPDGFTKLAAFPFPPGASSSPAPLPYPDDRPRHQHRPANGRIAPVRASDRTAKPELDKITLPRVSSPSLQGGPDDQSQPNVPGYPPALRPREGRGDGQSSQVTSRLAERRGNVPKPLPDSPGPEAPDKEGLFQRLPQREGASATTSGDVPKPSKAEGDPYPQYYQQYWPPPGGHRQVRR